MNLNCKLGGITIPLRQTPTQITDMCMVQPNGEVAWELTGNKAVHALAIYCEWLRGSLNGRWNSNEEFYNARDNVDASISEIRKVMRSKKKLVVWKM